MGKTISIILSDEELKMVDEIRKKEEYKGFRPTRSDIIRAIIYWNYEDIIKSDKFHSNKSFR